jgi:two-component sensor histidine kinase
MPLSRVFGGLIPKTRALSRPARYMATIGVVLAFFMIRRSFDQVWTYSYAFTLLFLAIIICAAMFDAKSGYLATILSSLLVAYFYLPPIYSFAVASTANLLGLAIFIIVGVICTMLIETINHALDELRESERIRALQLKEFRHRTRNDLQNLVGLLLLRARGSQNADTQKGLKDAAAHAMALARIHTRLTTGEDFITEVDTWDFITGLVADLENAHRKDGIRPIAFVTKIEPHFIDSERAVHLGMIINEAITNALKYAYPDENGGFLTVTFRREAAVFRLCVSDDGVGLMVSSKPPVPEGLGTRLLKALAAQLRGTFTRVPGDDGRGTVAELVFPVEQPGRRKI